MGLIILIILIPILILILLTGLIVLIILTAVFPGRKEYNESMYKKLTNKTFFDVSMNKGLLSEYLTWKILNKQPEYKKILINLYIPKQNGETSEIDAIMINKYGIFVFESKGYSGWIFGSEDSKTWAQVIYNQKYSFYNPVIQNRNHIKALASLLEIEDMNIFKSYIVFSERCELKKITITRPNLKVIKRTDLENILKSECIEENKMLTYDQIVELNNKISKYMFTDSQVKEKHNQDILKKYKHI